MEVKNEPLLWEWGPELRPLLGGCPFIGGSFIRGSTVLLLQLAKYSTFIGDHMFLTILVSLGQHRFNDVSQASLNGLENSLELATRTLLTVLAGSVAIPLSDMEF